MTEVIEQIKAGQSVVAVLAPAIEGQFGERVSLGMIKQAVKRLGYSWVTEAAVGADIVAVKEAEELAGNIAAGRKMTTSCCPSFVELIKKHYPKVSGNISKTPSPMAETGKYIKTKDSRQKVVFIGPCIAKKAEAGKYPEYIDYVLTFEELLSMLNALEINFEPCENGSDGSLYGRKFAQTGGVSEALLKAASEISVSEGCRLPAEMLGRGGVQKGDFTA
jgi:ferredoxin hydrogenase large subunit